MKSYYLNCIKQHCEITELFCSSNTDLNVDVLRVASEYGGIVIVLMSLKNASVCATVNIINNFIASMEHFIALIHKWAFRMNKIPYY